MPNWAEEVTAIATVVLAVGAVAAIGAAVFAGQQVREARIGRQAEVAADFFRRWSDDPMVATRRLVASYGSPEIVARRVPPAHRGQRRRGVRAVPRARLLRAARRDGGARRLRLRAHRDAARSEAGRALGPVAAVDRRHRWPSGVSELHAPGGEDARAQFA